MARTRFMKALGPERDNSLWIWFPELKLHHRRNSRRHLKNFRHRNAPRAASSWYSVDLSVYSRGLSIPLALFLDDLQWLDAANARFDGGSAEPRSDVRHLMLNWRLPGQRSQSQPSP